MGHVGVNTAFILKKVSDLLFFTRQIRMTAEVGSTGSGGSLASEFCSGLLGEVPSAQETFIT